MKESIFTRNLSFAIAIIIFGAFFLFSCNNSKKNDSLSTDLVNNPNSASSQLKGDLPIFKFEKDEHDFGRIIEGEKVTYSFKFKNVGKSDLVIASASSPRFSKKPC